MATRRMFSKTITSSSSFLMMPPTSRLLYYDLGMSADDDGFCEHFVIMKMTDAKPDDLKVLQAKGFVKVFDDKVLIIQNWKENNYIRTDRYTASKYLEIYKEELKALANIGQPKGNQGLPQVRLDKGSIGKEEAEPSSAIPLNPLINLFKEINPSYEKFLKNTTQRKALTRLIKKHGEAQVITYLKDVARVNKLQYAPVITTPLMLEDKLGQLILFLEKEKPKKLTSKTY